MKLKHVLNESAMYHCVCSFVIQEFRDICSSYEEPCVLCAKTFAESPMYIIHNMPFEFDISAKQILSTPLIDKLYLEQMPDIAKLS